MSAAGELLAEAGTNRFSTILADPPWRFHNRTGKVSQEKSRQGRLLYSPKSMNKAIAMGFEARTAGKISGSPSS